MRKLLTKNLKAGYGIVFARLAFSLMAFLVVTVSSLAWYTANRTVTSIGQKTKVTASANLVITKTSDGNISSLSNPIGHVSVSFDATNELDAATHDDSLTAGTSGINISTRSGLKYVSNPEVIDMVSGTSSDAILTDVTASSTSPYYVDYAIDVAATKKKISTTSKKYIVLKATITSSYSNAFHKAKSIDYYVKTNTESTYKYMCTQNIANGSTGAVIYKVDGTTGIPVNTSGYIQIVMRTYYDGELEDSSHNTYINTRDADESSIADMTVTIVTGSTDT